jgi:glyoxylase-like metal-dependent hydrolase (beta-lactamase superfamily II)
MKIGPYTIHSIATGTFSLDGGAMFGIVPWVFWSKLNPPDERLRILLAARCWLIQGNGKTILVDDGNGTKWSAKLKDIYRLDNTNADLLSSLKNLGVSRNDVTDVILTHLHFDHAGGSTMMNDGKLEPTFPRAKYYVQRKHWELSQNPTDKDRASFMSDDFMPLMDRRILELIEGEVELFPGIEVLVCNGHTAAQQLPKISDGNTTMLFCCDLVPTTSHLPYPYIMAYDVRPLVTLEEKKKILPRAFEEHWILFLEHDPVTEAITLKKSDKGFVIDQKLKLD